ncbi:MAG: S41 family peptidase [Pseudomonadota bacterium]
MAKSRQKRTVLWSVLIFSALFLIIGGGFHKRLVAGTDETYEELKIFTDVLDIVEKNYVDTVDSKELIRGAIKGMLGSLDPHSSYLLPDDYKELQIDTHGEFGGLGIVITKVEGVITVISPIEGTPAFGAGIEAGDKIIKVDGANTKDMALEEAVKKMRGPKGTKVTITIIREGLEKPKDFSITRDIIPLKSVRSFSLKDGYGYIRITNFRDKTTEDLEKALSKLESEKVPMRGLVLDLRHNPGGLLDQAIKVADLFLEDGTIVSIKGRIKAHNKTYTAHPDKEKRTYPIIVLINGGSASAAEIVAGALQDHGRALILGTSSFGKGSVQAIEPMRDGSGLKLTIARYYTPSGNSIQARGIIPDIEVKVREISGEKEEKHIKEKDLKNHIESDNDIETPESDTVSDDNDKDTKAAETLLAKDNQVMEALQILTSWDIFSKMSQQATGK